MKKEILDKLEVKSNYKENPFTEEEGRKIAKQLAKHRETCLKKRAKRKAKRK
jgi:hypothetical protein